MEFEVLNETFFKKLKMLNGFVTKNGIGVYVKIEALENDTVTLEVNGNNNFCRISMVAKIEECGSVLVMYKELYKMLSSANDVKALTFVKDDDYLHIFSVRKEGQQDFSFITPTINIDIANKFDTMGGSLVELSSVDLVRKLNVAIPFANKDDFGRQHLIGVRMEYLEDGVVFKTTDGRRLCETSVILSDGEINEFDPVTIPLSFAEEMLKEYALIKEMIMIYVSNKSVVIKNPTITMGTSLISQQFPNFDKIIPSELGEHFVVELSELEKALKKASVCCIKDPRVNLNLCANSLEVKATDEDRRVSVDIACSFDGEEKTIACNYRYLSDLVKVFNNSRLSLYNTEKGLLAEDNNGTFLIAKMR